MNASRSETAKIFENIIFLADVFGDLPAKDFPSLPVLEMARCFELTPASVGLGARAPRRSWQLWN